MGKSYSADLRERVIGFIETGRSRRQAALRFRVSPSFAVKLMSRRLSTGSSTAAKTRPPSGRRQAWRHAGFLIGRVQARPDITMARSFFYK